MLVDKGCTRVGALCVLHFDVSLCELLLLVVVVVRGLKTLCVYTLLGWYCAIAAAAASEVCKHRG